MLTNDDYAKAFHEIKNSITIVNSSLQLLERYHPEIAAYEYWKDSRDALDYLREMIRELSQANLATDFPLQPTSLALLLNNVLATIRGLRTTDDFHCQCNIPEGLPLIMADSCRLTQAIMNIVKNAFEAMQGVGTIILNVFLQNDSIHLEIIDFGGGISDEFKKHMFTPFFTSKQNGTGLGLSITKQIIESHHGALTYVSRDGDGCTFSISLPALTK
jgi:signal transduction histidine kinase